MENSKLQITFQSKKINILLTSFNTNLIRIGDREKLL